MTSTHRTVSIIVVALALAVFAGAALGEGVWVSDDDELHVIHEGEHVFLSGEGDEFDLADLRDGETRVFGKGDRTITATRDGDQVTLTGTGREGADALDLVCRIDRDKCKVVTYDEESGKVMLVVKKESECEHGDGDCREISLMMGLADGAVGARSHVVLRADHGHASVFVVGEGDHVLLRCPEGDTTMRVAKDEAEDGYLCPKHSIALEKVESRGRVHKIKIDTSGTGGEEM
jgi:hypothetical protein